MHIFSDFADNTKNGLLQQKKGKNRMKALNVIVLTVAIIGAVNWGLIGFFNFNLVDFLFGSASMLSKIIYGLVGLCGLYLISFYGSVSER